MITVERSTTDDIPQLTALLSSLFDQEADFQPDPARQARGLRLIIGEKPDFGRIFVARDGKGEKAVVGMVNLLFTISTAEGAPVALLEDLIVRKDYRGRGVGSLLLRHAIDFARTNGFARITLLTDLVNDRAIRFYAKHGFTRSAMVPMRLAPR